MQPAARLLEPNDSDGIVIGDVASTVHINGLPAALLGSIYSPHAPYGPPHPPHAAATIVSASNTVIVEGRGLARVGDSLSCGHTVVQGSPNVRVG